MVTNISLNKKLLGYGKRYFEVLTKEVIPFWLKNSRDLYGVINNCRSVTRIAKPSNSSADSSWDKFFLTRVDGMESDYDAVVVFGGTNDHDHGDAAFGSFDDRREDAFYGALHLLSKKLIEKHPESLIIFMTPLHRFDEQEYISKPDGKYLLKDYVNAIREVAQHYSIPVLDLYAVSAMSTDVEVQNSIFFTDGVHPSDRGHKRIAERLDGFWTTL